MWELCIVNGQPRPERRNSNTTGTPVQLVRSMWCNTVYRVSVAWQLQRRSHEGRWRRGNERKAGENSWKIVYLYDFSQEYYANDDKKDAAWREVSMEMEIITYLMDT
jgi:hypothetical protein